MSEPTIEELTEELMAVADSLWNWGGPRPNGQPLPEARANAVRWLGSVTGRLSRPEPQPQLRVPGYFSQAAYARSQMPACPACGAQVDTIEGRGSGVNTVTPCGHEVQVTVWPDRPLLERYELEAVD